MEKSSKLVPWGEENGGPVKQGALQGGVARHRLTGEQAGEQQEQCWLPLVCVRPQSRCASHLQQGE